jgi:8-oxo-dGTP pyrophosphatase MutT (NUDIX family)
MNNEIYCNNCGKNGHLYHQCKLPITSIGIVAFRIKDKIPEYLMIRRKDTLGYVDFMRGKYSLSNKDYILNLLNHMTVDEKNNLKTLRFIDLWKNVWGDGDISTQYKNEETISYDKFTQLQTGVWFNKKTYTLVDLINESSQLSNWEESEWGFPKGRRNNRETDYDCALREFKEETGYKIDNLTNIQNIIPYEEIFTGSNYKSYKHKYFLMYMDYNTSLKKGHFETSEVSKMEWATYEQGISVIRDYNIERKRILNKIHHTITENIII